MTREEAIKDIQDNILPVVGGKSLQMAIEALKAQADLQPTCNNLATDCISRQDAIDHWRLIIDATSTDSRYNMGFVDGLEFCISHLSTMPSAQPEHFADVSNMDDGELDFVQKHEKIPVELRVSAQPKPCEDAVSRQTLQKELALYPIDDITSEDEAGYNRAINDVQKMVLHLPSAQPVLDRTKISDLLEKIYSIQSVHLSTEGVIAKKYYCKQLWMELFGSEDMPTWMD